MKRVVRVLLLLVTINVYGQNDQETARELVNAIRISDEYKVEQILDSGFPVDYVHDSDDKKSLLHIAVGNKVVNKNIVTALLEHGADIYAMDSKNGTPFMSALWNKSYEIADILIEKYNYDINTPVGPMLTTDFKEFASPLTYSVLRGDDAIIEYLISHGIDTKPAAHFLLSAVSANQYGVIDKYASCSFGLNHSVKEYNDSTALFIANERNNVEMVKYLLAKGADLYHRNASLMTVFDVALSLQFYDLTEMYIDQYNYDVNTLDIWHRKSLFYYTINEKTEELEYLFKKGVSPNSYQYDTSHYLNVYFYQQARASKPINLDVVKLYFQYGLDVREQDAQGYTYFHNVAMTNDASLLSLVETSPDALDIQTFEDHNTALLFSVFSESYDITRRLVEMGADVNIRNESGNTVLHYLALKDNPHMMKYFLDNGADPDIQNNEGKTAIDLCSDIMLELLDLE